MPMQRKICAAKSLSALKLSADFVTDASNFFRSSTTEYLLHVLIKIQQLWPKLFLDKFKHVKGSSVVRNSLL